MNSLSTIGPAGTSAGQGSQQSSGNGLTAELTSLISEFAQLLELLSQAGASQGGPANAASSGSQAGAPQAGAPQAGAPQAGAPQAGAPQAGAPQAGAPQAGAPQAGAPQAGAPQTGAGPHAPASDPGKPGASAGTGPNTISITNNQDHAITVGKFKNGESTTDPSAKITLQPHQTGSLKYENGEGGYAAQADASGKFQPTASRLEYEADKDGKMKYPDVSYIDGRNASISLNDGAGLHKGDSKSIADSASPDIVTKDAGGGKTIAGWYDGSTSQMQAGGAFMQKQLGTSGAYLHPDDDKLSGDQNPMSGTQKSTINATFGDA